MERLVRVVGGRLGGRRLNVPPGTSTRPTTERVREALFNVLGARVAGARVLDLYAGSGSLGIEALSRGASFAVFVEMARGAAEVVRGNLSAMGLTDPAVARVLQRSIEKSLEQLAVLGPFDLCLVDPPFAAVRDGTALRVVDKVAEQRGLCSPECLMILEYPADQPDPAFHGLVCEQVRSYGDTRLAFLRLGPTLDHNRLGDLS